MGDDKLKMVSVRFSYVEETTTERDSEPSCLEDEKTVTFAVPKDEDYLETLRKARNFIVDGFVTSSVEKDSDTGEPVKHYFAMRGIRLEFYKVVAEESY